ncbi:hypothetical protein PIROE2DRAFT_14768 [Piromyces sp. E2]|nr:hypothetical protein PIROE2DRAFT_14768 [Piromyces sp. E2]|eukprot:OUM59624.1 hypothetical protein PIROE2DRAFT_14768 [Piromyces sp. E2]
MKIWIIGSVISPIFCFVGEIIGDWYLLIRTRAILCTERIPKLLYITCIIYNISKIIFIFGPIYLTPSSIQKVDIAFTDRYYLFCVIASVIVQVTSIIYDLTIIHYLRKNLFRKTKENKILRNNNFFEKLKQTSEYRIIISVLLSFSIIPITTILYLQDRSRMEMYNTVVTFRYIFVYINYYMMYIDQVLLRFYAERNNTLQFMVSSSNSVFNPYPPKNMLSYPLDSSTHSTHSSHSNHSYNQSSGIKPINFISVKNCLNESSSLGRYQGYIEEYKGMKNFPIWIVTQVMTDTLVWTVIKERMIFLRE